MKLPTEVQILINKNPNTKDSMIGLWLAGSLSYGTNIPGKGDVDVRGVSFGTVDHLLGLHPYEQVLDNVNDTVIYSFDKFMSLLLQNNPNIVESLGCLPEHYFILTPIFQTLLDNKERILSKRLVKTLGGYARAQLYRLQHTDEKDVLIDTGRVDLVRALTQTPNGEDIFVRVTNSPDSRSTKVHAELASEITGLIPSELGDLIHRMKQFEENYTNTNHRNRKHDAEKTAKHAMHIVRLYLMGIEVMKKGVLKTYRAEDKEYLLEIRKGLYRDGEKGYGEEFMKMAEELGREFDAACKVSSLRDHPDTKWANEFVIQSKREFLCS